MVSQVFENACPQRNLPLLTLTEEKDDATPFSRPPRRWGGPESKVATSVSRRGENACPQPIHPSLALKEGGDDQTNYSGPPRRWGGPEWSAKAMVCWGREKACTRRIWASVAQIQGEDDEKPHACTPQRWDGHGKNNHRRVSASVRHKVGHCDSRAVPYGCIMEQRLNSDLSPNRQESNQGRVR